MSTSKYDPLGLEEEEEKEPIPPKTDQSAFEDILETMPEGIPKTMMRAYQKDNKRLNKEMEEIKQEFANKKGDMMLKVLQIEQHVIDLQTENQQLKQGKGKELSWLIKGEGLEDLPEDFEVKVAKPDSFEGKPETVDAFLAACELVFLANPRKYKYFPSRLMYLLSYVNKGIAQEWKEEILQNLDRYIKEIAGEAKSSDINALWNTYKQKFREQWKNHSNKEEQQYKLQRLRQGNDTLEQYKIKFSNAARETGYEEQALITYFKQGLKDAIKMRIYGSGIVPKTLDEWKDRATIIDAAWREGELNRSPIRRPIPPKGNLRSSQLQRPRLPDEEYQRRRTNKLCFKCGKSGHMARECRSQARTVELKTIDEDNGTTPDTTSPEEDFA